MIGDRARESSNVRITTPLVSCARFQLDGGLISQTDLGLSKDTIHTAGRFGIRYITQRRKKNPPRPFSIACDILDERRTRFASYEDFVEDAKERPEVAFLIKWSTISPELFKLAEEYKGVWFGFSIKYVEYKEHLYNVYVRVYGHEPPPDYSYFENRMFLEAEMKRFETECKMMRINERESDKVKKQQRRKAECD